ncbi:MAG: hypothetical protein P8J50_02740 [Acidimicrobiales bacterium]|nr:hypothetical protein [Acidimicrobiales bacterium]
MSDADYRPIHFLHIGKTGGTVVNGALEDRLDECRVPGAGCHCIYTSIA